MGQEYYENIEPGTTEIRIRELNFTWEDIQEPLQRDLSETYEMFLGGGVVQEEHDFELLVNGEPIEPPLPVEWSFCPLDGYFPRRYEGFQLFPNDEAESEAPIIMHVTVGLMRQASQKESGTDVFCQRRKVLVRDTGEEGGFGSGKHKLGTFGTGQKRLRIIVELETDGDAERLPWDAQKSHLNQYDPVAQEMYIYLNRVAKHYYSATYSKIPQSILRPYDETHRYAENDGGVYIHDYNDRVRVTDRPDADAPTIKQVRQIAETHAQLGIRYEDDRLKPEAYPAYHSLLEETFEREVEELDELVDIQGPTTGINYESIKPQIKQIEAYARQHASEDIYVPGIAEWAKPRYHAELQTLAKLDELEPVDRELDLTVSKEDKKEEALQDDGQLDDGKSEESARTETVQRGQTLQFVFEDDTQREQILEALDLSSNATATEAAKKLLERLQQD